MREVDVTYRTAISPNACTVQNIMIPSVQYAMTSAAGPPVARADPDPTNRPVPIEPPMAIICKCLCFNFMASAGCAGGWFGRGFPFSSTSTSETRALSDMRCQSFDLWQCLRTENTYLGFSRNESIIRVKKPMFCWVDTISPYSWPGAVPGRAGSCFFSTSGSMSWLRLG